jgi:hypothetical protein
MIQKGSPFGDPFLWQKLQSASWVSIFRGNLHTSAFAYLLASYLRAIFLQISLQKQIFNIWDTRIWVSLTFSKGTLA